MFDAASNIDVDAWNAAAELGWFVLGLPEASGGVGGGLTDEALLFREIGRSLASGPFLSSVLAVRVAAFGGEAALADEIASGRPVGLIVPDSLGAVANGVVDGSLQLVDVDAPKAGALALIADEFGAAIVEVGSLKGLSPIPCYDDATRLHRATAHALRPIAAVESAVDPIARRGHVLAAAMLTGITEATRDISVEHAKTRVQFNQPIGVNQAIKHPCADMAVRAQLALAQTLFAAVAHDEGRADADFHAVSAHLVAAEAAEFTTTNTIQVLGGMGFTFEHDGHLYAKRAVVLGHLFGGATTQLTQLLGLPAAL